jgi:2-oxoglutarate ferredoxin oxidoreductase subunit beta
MVAPSQPQTTPQPPRKYSKTDFQTNQEVRWCPGCGDYAILNAAQQVFAQLGFPKEKMVMVSGIGCSSRFPYYVNSYGFHTIHGRAPALATGVKLANPDLQVWVVTGDGDALSIGGNHLIHALRRNVDLKILLFIDQPINPISLALASEATFIARSVDVYAKHLMDILKKVAEHKGSAFVEIYQNCNIFNDKAFEKFTEREVRDDQNIMLEHGKPITFAKGTKGVRLNGLKPEVVTLGQNGITEKDLIVHDEHNTSLAYLLSRLNYPNFPEPIGVFRNDKLPTLEERYENQIADVKKKEGEGDLKKLLFAGDMWEIK